MSGSSTRRSTSEIPQPPLASFGILKKAIESEFDTLDHGELSRRVYAGVLLKSNEGQGELQGQPYTHKYWVDVCLNKSCWIVLAKALSITSSDNSEYWKWTEEGEPCYQPDQKVLIAQLNEISWLEIRGTCKTTTLSPKTAYQVEIIVKMGQESGGWGDPVTLSLTLPDGHKQERVEYLGRLAGWGQGQWTSITIGTFETTPRTVGEINFSLTQTDGHWKSGLLVKGVRLTPLP